MPDEEYIRRAWERSVLPLSRQMGVEMQRPEVRPRTRLAHEAADFARTAGRGEAMASALLAAYFQQGRDIGQIDVLCEVGREAGLETGALRACLEERSRKSAVEGELNLARAYGIRAVPTFIIGGRYLLQGLVGEEDLVRVIRMCRGEGLIQVEAE